LAVSVIDAPQFVQNFAMLVIPPFLLPLTDCEMGKQSILRE